MDYVIRPMKPSEYSLLEEFLYQAIFIPEGCAPVERSVVQLPEMQVYIEEFGRRKEDQCTVAERDGNVVGAVWSRRMKDYGHVGDEIPSLAMSVRKEERGCGVGTALLEAHLSLLRECGCPQVSLSVQKANYALKMYQKAGFQILSETEEEYLMMICLSGEEML